MDPFSIHCAKASLLYRTGRFTQASQALELGLAEEKKNEPDINNSISNMKSGKDYNISTADTKKPTPEAFVGLSCYAIKADQAMCSFRSVAVVQKHKEGDIDNFKTRLSMAKEANDKYMEALEKATWSIFSESSMNPAITFMNASTSMVIGKDRLQTAMSIIMTSVSMSWLILHDSSDDNVNKARKSLYEGISLAATCFRHQNPKFRPTWREGLYIIESVLDECSKVGELVHDVDTNRLNNALSKWQHAVNVIHRGENKPEQNEHHIPMCTNTKRVRTLGTGVECNGVKRRRISNTETEDATNKYDESTLFANNESDSALQEAVLRALYCHSQGFGKKEERDRHIQDAINIQKGGMAQRLEGIFQTLDFLSCKNAVSEQDFEELKKKLTSLSLRSIDIAMLFASLLGKVGMVDDALDIFEGILKLGSDCDGNLDKVISNLSHCFLAKGELELAREISLYYLTKIGNDPNASINENAKLSLIHQHLDSSSENDKKILWTLLYIACLTCDLATCKTCIDRLKDECSDPIISIMSYFVDIQLGEGQMRGNIEDILMKDKEDLSLQGLGMILHKATDIIGKALRAKKTENMDLEEASKILTKARSVWDRIQNDVRDECKGVIEACIYNNLAIVHFMKKNRDLAYSYFLTSLRSLPKNQSIYNQPRFNIALAFWSEGKKDEACKVLMSSFDKSEHDNQSLRLKIEGSELDLEAGMSISHSALTICALKHVLNSKS